MSSFVEIPLVTKNDLPKDTGWRNVMSLLGPTAWEGAATRPYLLLKRSGDLVTVAARIRTVKAYSNYGAILQLPAGFRPKSAFSTFGVAMFGASLTAVGNRGLEDTLSMITTAPIGTDLIFEISFRTGDTFPLPAAYPGTPA